MKGHKTGKIRRKFVCSIYRNSIVQGDPIIQDQKEVTWVESNAYKYERMFLVAVLSFAVHFITCFHTAAVPYRQKSSSDLVGHVFSIAENKILVPFIT